MAADRQEELHRWLAGSGRRYALNTGPDAVGLGAEIAEAAESFVRLIRKRVLGTESPPFTGSDDPAFKDRQRDALERWIYDDQTPEDETLDRALRALQAATGFDKPSLHEWIMFGRTPRLPRVQVQAGKRVTPLPNGALIHRRVAVVTFNAPVTDEEVREIYREYVRPAFEDQNDRDRQRYRNRTLTELDRHLETIRRRHPGLLWREILEVWRRTPAPSAKSLKEWQKGSGGVKLGALKKRWSDMRKKERIAEVHPAPEDT